MKKITVVKKLLLQAIAALLFCHSANAQACDIQIKILEDKYMFGIVEKLQGQAPVRKMQVTFSAEYMEVIMPVDGENYLIRVVNENCRAYCSRAKRIRQLHSGDEKLVRNLFEDKQEDILSQIKSCEG